MSLLMETFEDSDHVDDGDHGTDAMLLLSACTGNVRACEALLCESDADVNHEDEHGNSAFIHAAACGNLAVCQLLLHHGADINHYNKDGCTALSKAAEGNHSHVCTFLLEIGVDVNHTNNEGRSPLMLAAIAGGVESCNVLIQHRAKINMLDNNDFSAADMAKELKHEAVRKLLRDNGAEDSLGRRRKRKIRDKDCIVS